MANTISIYTINKIPTDKEKSFKDVDAKLIYETTYSPTIVTDIFSGARFIKQAPSILWNETTASVSDFVEGVRLFTLLLPTIMLISNIDPVELREAGLILNRKKGKFFITDFTEISKSKDINKENSEFAKEAIKSATQLKKIVSISKEKKRVRKLEEYLNKSKRLDIHDLGIGGFK
jgi:hypothetical protein